jgi:hypothetical protein
MMMMTMTTIMTQLFELLEFWASLPRHTLNVLKSFLSYNDQS